MNECRSKTKVKVVGPDALFKPTRRSLLIGAAKISASLALTRSLYAGTSDQLRFNQPYLIGGLMLDRQTRAPVLFSPVKDQDYFLVATCESTGEQLSVATPFAPHSVLVHPTRPATVLAIPNHHLHSEAMEVDLQEMRVTRLIKGVHGHGFYGHGIFDTASRNLYLVEFTDSQSTIITVRDSLSYHEIGRFETNLELPHTLLQLDGQHSAEMLVCAASGASVFDMRSGSQVRHYECPNALHRFGHAQLISGGNCYLLASVLGGTEKQFARGGVYKVEANKATVEELSLPKQATGEALSACIHANLLIVTHQESDYVSVWELPSNRLVKLLDLKHTPRGVVFSENTGLFLLTNALGQRFSIDPRSPEMVHSLASSGPSANSSHILRASFG